jgi:hypothetical protein
MDGSEKEKAEVEAFKRAIRERDKLRRKIQK